MPPSFTNNIIHNTKLTPHNSKTFAPTFEKKKTKYIRFKIYCRQVRNKKYFFNSSHKYRTTHTACQLRLLIHKLET